MVVRLKDLEDKRKSKETPEKLGVVRLSDIKPKINYPKELITPNNFEQTFAKNAARMVREQTYEPVAKAEEKPKKNIILDIANKAIAQGRKNMESLTEGRETVLGSPLAPRDELKIPDKDSPLSERAKFIGTILPRLATDPIAEIGSSVYMPGASPSKIMGAYDEVGNLLTRYAPKLANTGKGRVVEELIKDIAISAPVEFGYAAKTAEDNKELFKQTAIGTSIGAGLGGAVSSVVEGVQALRRPVRLEDLRRAEVQPVQREVANPIQELDETPFSPENKAMYPKSFNESYGNNVETWLKNNPQLDEVVEPPKVTRLADMKPEVKPIEPTIQPKPIPSKVQSQLDELESIYQSKVETAKRGGLHPEDMSKQLKGMAMVHSAEKRKLVQGDKLVTVEGGLTNKELSDVIKRERSNYSGKEVIVDGQDGVVTKNAFGKVGVKFADGQVKFVDPDSVKPKVDIDELIKQQSIPKVSPKAVEPVAPKAEPVVQPVAPKTESTKPIANRLSEEAKKYNSAEEFEESYKLPIAKTSKSQPDFFEVVSDNMDVSGFMPEGKTPYIYNIWYKNVPKEGTELSLIPAEILNKGTATRHVLSAIDEFKKQGNSKFRVFDMSDEAKAFMKNLEDKGYVKAIGYTKEVGDDVGQATYEINKSIKDIYNDSAGTLKPRGFSETLNESEKTPQGFKEKLKAMYEPITNEGTLAQANKRISDNVEEATSYVLSKERYTAEKATTAMRLIDHYNSVGNYERAVDIAEKVSEEATRAGQGIQALSMFNKLSPEGVLVYAQRKAKIVNENMPIWKREKVVTEDMAAQISDLANSTKKMTGVTDNSNNVIDILDRAKSGEILSDADSNALRTFINDSRQFVKESTRKVNTKPPTIPKDKRVRDNVVSFLDAQETAAKERLRAKGIQISSTPLDVWADYAIIGASKMGKGTIKFADWSESMVKDLGESIKPQLKQLYERSRETFESSTKKITRETIDRAEKLTEKVIKGKKLEGAEADSLRKLAQKVSSMSGETKRLASQDLQQVLQALDNPSALRRVATTQTIGQLLNPKTQVRNALGNELFYRIERLNKLVATPIDIARSKITGGDRTVTFRTNNQGEYWKNWMRGLKAGWKGVNVQGLETQYDLGSPSFKSKWNPMTYLEKSLGASLKSFDTAAYMRAYNNTVGELATLKAINQGKKGDKAFIENAIKKADDNILQIADEYGRYVTFQDNNLISKGLVKLKRGLNLGKDFGMGDLILKYPKTPGALLMRALEYSPAGFLRSAVVAARPWYKKTPETGEVMQALSRAIIGTMGLSGMGYFLMDKGILTGQASKDKDIRGLQQSAGQGQYQVNMSALKRFIMSDFDPESAKIQENDYLYTYDWMQPVSMAISIGANTAKNMSEGDNKLSGIAGTAYNSLEGGLGTLTEQSVLQGLKQAAEGYPGQSVTDKIMDILSDIPSSFVPTASNQIRQMTDNARRETYDPSKLQQSLNRAQTKIPGLAGKLPQQSDTLGRPKETYQDNNWFNVMFNPGFASRYKLSPEAKLIVGLIEETGDETLAPRAPSKSITIDGVSVKMTTEEYARMQQYQGEETRKRLEKINPNASLKGRINRVEDALDKAGKKARDKLKGEMK